MKRNVLYSIVTAILGAVAIYTGISVVMTVIHSLSQSHLESGTEKFYFLGYDLLAGLNGLVFICAVAVSVILIIKWIKGKHKR